MDKNSIIETIGSITKMEHLRSLEQNVLKNTLVLKTTTPFPGVKDKNLEANSNLDSHFIILRYRYAPEKINRINVRLLKNFELKRYPSYGEIITHEAILPCIRLKDLDISTLSEIQNFLKENDLKLMAYSSFDKVSRIKIFKTFKLVEIADGLYRDLSEGKKFYIQINSTLNWKRFDYISKKIKYNLENKDFDAAMGVIYRFCGPENVIRIYDNDLSLNRALSLKRWYVSEIKKEIQISTMH